MVAENSLVYNEVLLLETLVESGVLAPKKKWQSVVKKIDKHITKIEDENKKLKEPNIKLDYFVPSLAAGKDPERWGGDKVEGRREQQQQLGQEEKRGETGGD